MIKLEFAPYSLKFKEPAGTSRGILLEKPTFLLKVYEETDPTKFGIGEAALFPGLSPEADEKYVWKLAELKQDIEKGNTTDLSRYSSIQFGLEQALLDFSNGTGGIYYPSGFTEGQEEIEINGLIWMGEFEVMMKRLESKIKEGFKCLKLKIGAICWEKEIEMIRHIRYKYNENELMIRVDANGAFRYDDCLDRLSQLAEFGVHSIEQPIKPGNYGEMAKLCKTTPLPIALDEELIGKRNIKERLRLIEEIKPQYIILKPSLCGGFSGALEWIEITKEFGTGWWVTSALESNIGLNALAQFTASIGAKGPQGLGTGNLFVNNFKAPLYLKGDRLKFNPCVNYDYSQFEGLQWNK